MNVRIYGTGSSGNMTVIDDFIIIDAGLAENPRGEAILLTHAHTDHTKALPKLGGIPLYATAETAAKLQEKWPYMRFNILTPNEVLEMKRGDGTTYYVKPVEVVHDAPCVGFDITCVPSDGDEKRILWLTDFCRITESEEPTIIYNLRKRAYDRVFIECNNTLTLIDLLDCYIADDDDTPLPRDEYHRRKSYQNHCNVSYVEKLFRLAGFNEEKKYVDPVMFIHKSSYYYHSNVSTIARLCKFINISNPLPSCQKGGWLSTRLTI